MLIVQVSLSVPVKKPVFMNRLSWDFWWLIFLERKIDDMFNIFNYPRSHIITSVSLYEIDIWHLYAQYFLF